MNTPEGWRSGGGREQNYCRSSLAGISTSGGLTFFILCLSNRYETYESQRTIEE